MSEEPEVESRDESIRKRWIDYGQGSRRRFAESLRWDADLYPEDIAEETLINGIMRDVERALKWTDPSTGLQFAMASAKREGRARVWMQPALFDFEDFEFSIRDRVRGATRDAIAIRKLYELCKIRFGRVPEVDGLPEILALANGDD